MNKKDIALTVGGVLATMVVAYLIYRMQQRDAAAAAAASAQASADQEAIATSPIAYQADPYAAAVASLNASSTGTTNPANIPASVTTSAAPDNNLYDTTDINDVLNGIIETFGPAIMAQGASPESVASMTIPTLGGGSQASALDGVPITAADAADQAAQYRPTHEVLYPAQMQTGFDVTSHPVTAHPITQVLQ